VTPLVFLPGMMCDRRLFAPQIAAFNSGRAVSVGDITGRDTMKALAADVLKNAPARFALAGLSMGGIVAMEMIAQAPERIERLALLDTNPRAEAPEMQARRAPQIEKVRAGDLRGVMRDEMKPNYLADGPNKPAILNLCMEMAEDLGPDVFIRQSLALRDRPAQQAALCRLTAPTLVLCGREDRACPVERHELMHRLIPHSTLIIIDDAGHLPTLEKPDETTAALARWLEAQ
jgi:pimeloyl-ACP methyl ester carboxylesterase